MNCTVRITSLAAHAIHYAFNCFALQYGITFLEKVFVMPPSRGLDSVVTTLIEAKADLNPPPGGDSRKPCNSHLRSVLKLIYMCCSPEVFQLALAHGAVDNRPPEAGTAFVKIDYSRGAPAAAEGAAPAARSEAQAEADAGAGAGAGLATAASTAAASQAALPPP